MFIVLACMAKHVLHQGVEETVLLFTFEKDSLEK